MLLLFGLLLTTALATDGLHSGIKCFRDWAAALVPVTAEGTEVMEDSTDTDTCHEEGIRIMLLGCMCQQVAVKKMQQAHSGAGVRFILLGPFRFFF